LQHYEYYISAHRAEGMSRKQGLKGRSDRDHCIANREINDGEGTLRSIPETSLMLKRITTGSIYPLAAHARPQRPKLIFVVQEAGLPITCQATIM